LVLRNTDLSRLAQVQAARGGGADAAPEQTARDILGRQVLTAHATIAPLGWLVFVELPVDEAYAPLYASIERSGVLLLAGLALAFLAGLLLARKMVVPIQALRAGAARIGSGDLSQRIAIKTGDELEALADQFNDMARRLQESYSTLEQKVESRTQELSEALQQQTATADVLKVISRSTFDLQPVLDALVESAARLCAADKAYVFRRDGEVYRLAANHGFSPEFSAWMKPQSIAPGRGTLVGRTVLEGKTVHLPDVLADPEYVWSESQKRGGFRTMLGVPLLREGVPIGVIALTRATPMPFTNKQIELVTTFADQAVIAIENVRLFDEVQARTRELSESLEQQTATSEVLRVISSSPGELAPVFHAMLANATKICEAKFGYMCRYEDGAFHIVAQIDLASAFAGYMESTALLPHPASGLGQVVRTKQIAHILDVAAGDAYRDRDPLAVAAVERGGVRTVLAVPMLKENELIGAIIIFRQEVRPFSDKHIELVTSFARQAVIAIENVRLLNELRARTTDLARSVEELKALGEVSRAVNSTLDLQTVLTTIVAKAVQLSSTEAGAIYVFSKTRQEFRLRATHGMDEAMIAAIRDQRIGAGESVIGQAAERREPVQIPDLRDQPLSPVNEIVVRAGYRGLLVVPLLRPNRIVGALVVRRREPGLFSASTVDLLQTFAAQSVLAIQNARLFREIEDKGQQLVIASQHKSQFLANMSHELRTPLNAILGYTELIIDGIYGAAPEKIHAVLQRVHASGKHLLGLINEVLDLSKIEAGQLTLSLNEYSLAEVVQNVANGLESLAAEKRLTLTVKLPDKLPRGHGDERRIMQVLLNLVGNAIKFTDSGGVGISADIADGAFEVVVADTGPGIAPEDQDKIFEEFHQIDSTSTRKKGGTGLGLAIAKRIIELHGGRIWVESEVGVGSQFHMTLPVHVEKQVAA
jgi:signal transduction histidine kinase